MATVICTSCKEPLAWFELGAASVNYYPTDEMEKVDLLLKCPDCGQLYNVFIPVVDLVPMEGC